MRDDDDKDNTGSEIDTSGYDPDGIGGDPADNSDDYGEESSA